MGGTTVKFRNGFVSNSSSSSYVIVGRCFESVDAALNCFKQNADFVRVYEAISDPRYHVADEMIIAAKRMKPSVQLDWYRRDKAFVFGKVIVDVINGNVRQFQQL